jgi:hypothetical protein
MQAKGRSDAPDPEATARRSALVLLVLAELLCTGVLVIAVILWL